MLNCWENETFLVVDGVELSQGFGWAQQADHTHYDVTVCVQVGDTLYSENLCTVEGQENASDMAINFFKAWQRVAAKEQYHY